jgi:hypothetical protein
VTIVLPRPTIVDAAGLIARAYDADTCPAPTDGAFHPAPTLGECCAACGCLCLPNEHCPVCQPGAWR